MTDTRILADSVIGYPDSLAIFSRPLQNVGIRNSKKVEHLPINDITSQSVIVFEVKPSGSGYLDLSKTRLKITSKIVKADGSVIKDFSKVIQENKLNDEEAVVSNTKTQSDGKEADTGSTTASSGSTTASSGSTTSSTTSTAQASDKSTSSTSSADSTSSMNASKSSGKTSTNNQSTTIDDESLQNIVAPCQNFFHAMFERCDIQLQNNLVTDSSTTYGYNALYKALQASREEKKSTMAMQMYFESDYDYSVNESLNWLSSKNPGLVKRGEAFTGSREVTMCGRIASEVFDVERLLVFGVPLKVTLYPSQPQFCLLSPMIEPPPNFKFVITKAVLEVVYIDIAPEIVAAHAEVMKNEPALYPFKKVETKLFAIPQNSYSLEVNSPFESRIPSSLVLGIVDAESVHGSFAKESLRFEHSNLRVIQCVVDGMDVGDSPIHTKYGDSAHKSSYMEGYNSMKGFGGIPNVVPYGYDAYFNGLTLYRFQFEDQESVTGSRGELIPLQRSGNLRVKLQFDKPVKKPKTLVAFGEFASGFKIDRNRAVHPM